jgi:hypothetical protein
MPCADVAHAPQSPGPASHPPVAHALAPLAESALVAAARPLARHRLDADAWLAFAQHALGAAALSPALARDVRRLVATAAAAVGRCPPCVVCTATRDALAQRVAQRVAGHMAGPQTPAPRAPAIVP